MMVRALLASTFILTGAAIAEAEYPDRPITFIVPFAPGGGADTGVRLMEPYLEACIDGEIVVIDKPGAGGQVGMTEIASSEPDGYTLGSLLTPNLPVSLIAGNAPRYDMDSFELLANLVASRVANSAAKGGKYGTIEELLAAAKESPVQAAITQFGADDHLVLLRLMDEAGVKFDFIPMVESPLARNSVIGGQIDVLALSVTESANFKEQLETLAVASGERFPPLPDVPTLRELGYDIVAGNTFLMGAPAGLPPEVKAKLDGCFQTVANDPAYQEAVTTRNFILVPMDAAEADAFVKGEYEAMNALWKVSPWLKE